MNCILKLLSKVETCKYHHRREAVRMVHASPSAFVDVQVMEAGELAEIVYESYVSNEQCYCWWRDKG